MSDSAKPLPDGYLGTHIGCGGDVGQVPCGEPGCCEVAYCYKCRREPRAEEIDFGDDDEAEWRTE